MKVQVNREALGAFCRERGIARLELFGSALREDFREDSDVDLLCSLRPDAHPTLFDWADMQGEASRDVWPSGGLGKSSGH